jgi:hypothetical protein
VTDAQLLTLAIAIIFPLSMLIYSNSRITEAKEALRAEIQSFRSEILGANNRIAEAKETLRAEIRELRAEMNAGFERISAQLKIHELEHHK